MNVPALQVELRCGIVGWVERLRREDGGGLWDWIGHVVRKGGVAEGPHLWRHGGQWREDGIEHELDIVRGLATKAAAQAAQDGEAA